MTEYTTKSKQHNFSEPTTKETASQSVLSRLGKWFMPRKDETFVNDAKQTSAVPVPDKINNAILPDEHKAGDEKKPAGGGPSPAGHPQARRHGPYRGSGKPGAPEKKSPSVKSSSRHRNKKNEPGTGHQPKMEGKGPTQPARSPAKGPKAKTGESKKRVTRDPQKAQSMKLLINRDEPEECRIALLENGRVESYHVETIVHAQTKGNIYKGKIMAVEPNLQAAFVEIGTEKNGFLPFSDVHPEYYCKEVDPDTHWKDINIQQVLKKGQEVLVQVVKEAAGNKGANVTTFLSLPGRYIVLMPGSDSAGISKKIEKESRRTQLRKLVEGLNLPEGIGYIIRTASEGITKKAIEHDFHYLLNLWQEIKNRGQKMPSPSLIYEERDVFSRFLRDHFTSDIQEILVDNEEAYEQVVNFLDLLPDSQKKTKAKLYQGSRPIFNQYQVETQIEQIYQPKVSLPSGGSIVISPTEALVAIDVNSGSTSKDKNFEETIFLANMEAAEELARQLRLRDLGGLIVVDFIDMRETKHIRAVEKKVKESMKRDKAKVDISRISKFGLLQISRQKLATPVQMGSYKVCEHCQGRGLVQSVETLALVYLRRIQTGVIHRNVIKADCQLPLEVAQYLLNKKRDDLMELEKRYSVVIDIKAKPAMSPTEGRIELIRAQPE